MDGEVSPQLQPYTQLKNLSRLLALPPLKMARMSS
jgi:hypothetical protein